MGRPELRKDQVDNRKRPSFEALCASGDDPNLRAIREVVYLERLYGDSIKSGLHQATRRNCSAWGLLLIFALLLGAGFGISALLLFLVRAFGY
jgi:hypothetical protein